MGNMSIRLGLIAAGLLITACGAPRSSVAGSTSPRPSASTATVTPGGSAHHALGIVAAQVAPSVAPDGAAEGARDTFDSGKDREIIAVLSLANLPPGTRVSYVRYIDRKYVNSKSATLLATSKYFYFKFDALPGLSFARGHYHLRLYVNDHAASEITYQVV